MASHVYEDCSRTSALHMPCGMSPPRTQCEILIHTVLLCHNEIVHVVRLCSQKRGQTVELSSLLGAIMAVGGSLATHKLRGNTSMLNQAHIL